MNPVDFLNQTVCMRIAPSDIHGVGVVAIKDIQKGKKLFADRAPHPYKVSEGNLSKMFPEVRELITERFPQATKGKGFVYPDAFLQGYMNHSDDPNYCNITDVALKDIKKGEEITEDYRNIEGWKDAYPWLVV